MRTLTVRARRRKNLLALAVAAVPLTLCSTASADRYWINSVTNSTWSSAANWNATAATGTGGAGVPGSSDNVFLDNTTANIFTITLNETDTISSLTIANTASGGSDTLSESGAFGLTVSNNLNLGSFTGSTGIYSLSGGTVTVSGTTYVGGSSSGSGGTGTLTVSGGTFTSTTATDIYANGTVTQSSGILTMGAVTQSGGHVTVSQIDIDTTNGFTTGSGTNAKSYSLSAGTLTVNSFEYLGYTGTASFTQTGGTHSIGTNSSDELDLGGGGASGKGTYTLSGTGTLAIDGNLDIAGSFGSGLGAGTLTQSAGTVSVTGTTFLFPNGTFSQTAGSFQSGTFNQSGGTASFASELYVDKTLNSNTVGSYTLSSGSLSDSLGECAIGETSGGTFTQSGGLNTVGTLSVGDKAAGTYMLSGTGSLSAGIEYVGLGGVGTFTQSGGSNTVSNLGVGYGDVGTYTLNSGSLNCSEPLITGDFGGLGTFNQSGGTCTIGTPGSPQELDIAYEDGSIGTYLLSGTGSATINGSAYIGGSSSGQGGPGTLSISGGTMTVTSGITLWSGDTLSQTAGLLNVGTITQNGGTATFTTLSIDSTATLSTGTTAKTYSMSGGTLTVNLNAIVGNKGTGAFSQPASTTVTVSDDLDIGAVIGSTGTYTLATAGTLSISDNLDIGGAGGVAGGSGTLTLSNGAVSVTGTTYLFNNGKLTQTGSGTFEFGSVNQSGGTASFASYLQVDTTVKSNTIGSYTLSSGSLSDSIETMGETSGGTFTQSGGFNTVSDTLYLGDNAAGTYMLSGTGSLSAGTEYVGFGGAGTFNQSGGSNTVSTLEVGDGKPGTYTLSSGSLNCSGDLAVGLPGPGTFNQTGGTCTIGAPGSPQELDIAHDDGSTGTYLLSGAGSATINGSVYVGGSSTEAGGTGILSISGGTMAVTSGITLWSGDTLSQTAGLLHVGTITQNGGTASFSTLSIDSTATLSTGTTAKTYSFTGGTLAVNGIEYVGNKGTGSLTNAQSTNTVTGDLDIGAINGSAGTYTLGYSGAPSTAGTLNVGGNLNLGGAGGVGGGTGTLNVVVGSVGVTGALNIFPNSTLSLSGSLKAGSVSQSGGTATVPSLTLDNAGVQSGEYAGSYTQSGGTLNVGNNEVVGQGGTGTFTQSGGTNNITGDLDLGAGNGGKGTYTLSSSGSVSVSGNVYIGGQSGGAFGNGTLNINGGTMTIGGATGLTLYSGNTLAQTAGLLKVGAITQSGGTATFNALSIDSTATPSTGTAVKTYNQTAGTITVNGNEIVGNTGTGSFTQPAVIDTVTGQLILAASGASVGTYTLNTAGTLTVDGNAAVGAGGSGMFNQSAGTANFPDALSVGFVSPGTYTLSGGTVNVSGAQEFVGVSGNGSFTQSSTSTNLCTYLQLGIFASGAGTYDLTGGTLTVSGGGVYVGGSSENGQGGNGTLTIGGGTMTVTGGSGITVFSTGTLTQTAGSLSVSAGITNNGTATLSAGSFTAGTFTQGGGSASLVNLVVDTSLSGGGSGNYKQVAGSFTLSGGSLTITSTGSTATELVGTSSGGTFTQSGGTNTTVNLGVGYTGPGTYTLSAGTLTDTGGAIIGNTATGTFTQSAGTVTIGTSGLNEDLDLGYTSGVGSFGLSGTGSVTVNGGVYLGGNSSAAGGTGTLTVSGGQFTTTGALDIYTHGALNQTSSSAGGVAAGSITQSGGQATVYLLTVDTGSGSGPGQTLAQTSYTLSGGTLSANHENIAYYGSGAFTQTGGTNTLTLQLSIAGTGGSVGTYTLSGAGTLNPGSVEVGGYYGTAGGNGTLTISGSGAIVNDTGTARVDTLGTLTQTAGTLTITGGLTNNGTATFSGGTFSPTTIDGTGSMTVNNSDSLTATHIRQNSLTIASNSTVAITDSAAPGTTTATSVLTDLTNSGTLNLRNNDLIITDSTQFSAVQSAITNAYHGGAWNQPGITSSSAALHPNSYGLGYATAGAVGTTSFDGQSVSSGTVLVKYTLLGDALLTGTVGLGDFNRVLASFNTGTLWSQGAFHPGASTGLADYNAVIANFNATASGSVAVGPALKTAASPSLKTAALSFSPDAATDLKLEVNTVTGDVYALATATTALTGYDIFDKSGNLLDSGDPNTDLNERLLSVPSSTTLGNQTTFRNATNYKLWATILDNTSTLAEGSNNGKLKQGTASTYDTINIPASGTIDFGDIYSTVAHNNDITFAFSEADPTNAGNPVTGSTYNGEVDYVGNTVMPEPGMLGLLGMGGIMMMRRRRRVSPDL